MVCSISTASCRPNDNTVIIYTGDQGMMLGEHDYMDKRWMYEESMRMPFLVRYPKLIKAGSTNGDLINNTDFAPMMTPTGTIDSHRRIECKDKSYF